MLTTMEVKVIFSHSNNPIGSYELEKAVSAAAELAHNEQFRNAFNIPVDGTLSFNVLWTEQPSNQWLEKTKTFLLEKDIRAEFLTYIEGRMVYL